MILLDTNAYSAYFKKDPAVGKAVKRAAIIYLSPIVIGELLSGFLKGNRTEQNIQELDDFVHSNKLRIPSITNLTSTIYAQTKYQLNLRGTPVPENDLWIAAQAIQTKSTIITYDRHFTAVPGIKIWN